MWFGNRSGQGPSSLIGLSLDTPIRLVETLISKLMANHDG